MNGVRSAIDQLEASSAAELRVIWEERRDTPPPPTLTARLMRHALAFDLQSEAPGTNATKAAKAWNDVIKQRALGQMAQVDPQHHTTTAPGTQILKEWAGVTHELIVQENGILWNGERYGSLSAVARAMTGTPRNGPRFFGVRNGVAK